MKNVLLVLLLLVGLIIILGCEQIDVSKLSDKDLERIAEKAIVCDKPYIHVGLECCLDTNDNSICDTDEKEIQTHVEEKKEEVKNESKEKSEKEEKNETEKPSLYACRLGGDFPCEIVKITTEGEVSIEITNNWRNMMSYSSIKVGNVWGICNPETVQVGGKTICTAVVLPGKKDDVFKQTIMLSWSMREITGDLIGWYGYER